MKTFRQFVVKEDGGGAGGGAGAAGGSGAAGSGSGCTCVGMGAPAGSAPCPVHGINTTAGIGFGAFPFFHKKKKKVVDEREDLPDDPGHPGIKPLDWKDVGKTDISKS